MHFVDFDLVFVEEEGLIHSLFNLELFREDDELFEEEDLSLDELGRRRRRRRRGRVFEERSGNFGHQQRVDNQQFALRRDLPVRVVETLTADAQ